MPSPVLLAPLLSLVLAAGAPPPPTLGPEAAVPQDGRGREGQDGRGGKEGPKQETQLPAAEAARAIEAALKGKDPAAAIEALRRHGRVGEAVVARAAAAGLQHKDLEVRKAAARALRFNEAPEATDALVQAVRDKKAMEETSYAVELYMAIGQKGDPRTLPVLTDHLVVDNGGNRVTQARILALGQIRDKRAVEAILDFMVAGRGRVRFPYEAQCNLSLAVLTGEDLGGRDSWMRWWNDHKATLKVSETIPETLPRRLRAAWDRAWE